MATIAGQTVWSEWIDRAKHADFYPIALKLGARLKRTTTSEFTGPCPFCGGTDRFSLNVKKNVCNCRKCDIAGDVVHFVEIMTGCGFIEACEFINQTPRPDRTRDETLQEKTERLAARAKWQAEHQEREEERRRIEEAKAKRDEEAIASILAPERAVPLAGTFGEAYLRGRGLMPHPRLTGDIKFVPDLDYWGAKDNGVRSIVHLATLPAVVAIIRDFSGLPIGISQTYLDPKEPRKWRPEGSPTNSAKKIRGEKKHGMIRLGRLGSTLALGEGWENCLAWHQLGYGPEDVTLAAAVDLGNLAGGSTGSWPHPFLKDADGKPLKIGNGVPDPDQQGVILRDDIRAVILLADLDSETYATAAKLRTAGNRFVSKGITVDIAWPARGRDFNDMLIASAGEDHGHSLGA